jgi:hypothetical protein
VNSSPIRRQTRDDHFTPIEETMSALNDLVKAGKVRYVGVSDAPAWKVAQAQTMAHFRGWNPLIALRIEYSLPGLGILVRALHPHFSTGKRPRVREPPRYSARSQSYRFQSRCRLHLTILWHVSGIAECSELISIVPKPVLLRVSRRSEPSDCRLQPGIPRSG